VVASGADIFHNKGNERRARKTSYIFRRVGIGVRKRIFIFREYIAVMDNENNINTNDNDGNVDIRKQTVNHQYERRNLRRSIRSVMSDLIEESYYATESELTG